MHRLRLFRASALLALLPLAAFTQPWQMTREGDLWVRTYNDKAPAKARLRINAQGPVTLHGDTAKSFIYEVKIGVSARSPQEARLLLERLRPQLTPQGQWLVVTTPRGNVQSSVVMLAPRLVEASISSSDGAIEADGIDGPLKVDTGADQVKVDRIHGDCTLATGGGDIQVGSVDGFLQATTEAGAIRVKTVGGWADLRTAGGDIDAQQLGGKAHCETRGGTVHVRFAGGPVTAINGGGPIIVERANGIVTAHNVAGPVSVGAAAGIRCESANGGIQLNQITGPMNVVTSMGNILASLWGSRLGPDSLLATGSGDITVLIPSNVGVTIRAENQMADTIRRIMSDFRDIQPRPRGTYLVAEGRVNGGGPLLQISASSGTIFIKRQ